jgi:hypothetical protein
MDDTHVHEDVLALGAPCGRALHHRRLLDLGDHVACLPGLDGDRIDVFIEALATAVSAECATGVDHAVAAT